MIILTDTFRTDEYHLPDFWTAYLANGDSSGYEDDEIALIKKFTDDLKEQIGEQGRVLVSIVPDPSEPEFSLSNDGGLEVACEVRLFQVNTAEMN